MCAGNGDGHWRGVCTLVFLAPVDDKGRSNDEHLCCQFELKIIPNIIKIHN